MLSTHHLFLQTNKYKNILEAYTNTHIYPNTQKTGILLWLFFHFFVECVYSFKWHYILAIRAFQMRHFLQKVLRKSENNSWIIVTFKCELCARCFQTQKIYTCNAICVFLQFYSLPQTHTNVNAGSISTFCFVCSMPSYFATETSNFHAF